MNYNQALNIFRAPRGPFTVAFCDGRPAIECATREDAERAAGGNCFEVSQDGGWHEICTTHWPDGAKLAEIWPTRSAV